MDQKFKYFRESDKSLKHEFRGGVVNVYTRPCAGGAHVHRTVADPGFSPGGTPTSKIAIIFQIFAENERIWTPGGGASLVPPFDPPMQEVRMD